MEKNYLQTMLVKDFKQELDQALKLVTIPEYLTFGWNSLQMPLWMGVLEFIHHAPCMS